MKTAVFFLATDYHLERNVLRKFHLHHNLMEMRGRDLRCLNNGFIPARGGFRYLGGDVTLLVEWSKAPPCKF